MKRSILSDYSSCSLLAGACFVVALSGCSSGPSNGQAVGVGGLPSTSATTGGAGGITAVGAGGTSVTGTAGTPAGGSGITGTAGTPTTGAGGAVITGTGGTSTAGAGGSAMTGSGGTGGSTGGTASTGGAAGAGGSAVALKHCDQAGESAAMPEYGPCGDMTSVKGVDIKFGPLGASMDINVGKGFENTDPADNATCPAFAALFNEPADVTKQLLDVGTQPCNATAPNTGTCLDFKLYSLYRPATWPEGKLPVISWANGTCAQPEGYGPLLRYVASYGFVIIAANSREVGTGKEPLHALDYLAAANADPMSPYYGHLDMDKVGVMGHSQGGASTVAAAMDARVKDVIIFNGGLSAVKPFLAISGDMDITAYTAAQMASSVMSAPKGAYLYYHNPIGAAADTIKGHLTLMLSPERVTDQTLSWWQMVFNGDMTATNKFVGSSCGFCGSASDYAYGEHGL